MAPGWTYDNKYASDVSIRTSNLEFVEQCIALDKINDMVITLQTANHLMLARLSWDVDLISILAET